MLVLWFGAAYCAWRVWQLMDGGSPRRGEKAFAALTAAAALGSFLLTLLITFGAVARPDLSAGAF